MSWPSRRMLPSLGSTIRLIIRRVVVLPQPEGPTRTVIARSGMSNDSRSTATVPSGYRFVTESIRIKTPRTLRATDPGLMRGESRPRVFRHFGGRAFAPRGRPPAGTGVPPAPGRPTTVGDVRHLMTMMSNWLSCAASCPCRAACIRARPGRHSGGSSSGPSGRPGPASRSRNTSASSVCWSSSRTSAGNSAGPTPVRPGRPPSPMTGRTRCPGRTSARAGSCPARTTATGAGVAGARGVRRGPAFRRRELSGAPVLTGLVTDVGRKPAERWAAALVLPGLVFTALAATGLSLGRRHWATWSCCAAGCGP